MKKELEALENWLSNSLIDLRVQCNEKRLTKDIYDNNVEKVKRDYNIIKQALTRPLDSELEEALKLIMAEDLKHDNPNIIDNYKVRNKALQTLRQALRLTPKITADEIVKELTLHFGDEYEIIYDKEECEFHMENDTICYLYKERGGNLLKVKFPIDVPLKLAHKITSFFIQESESE